jgi:hypothetical protein
MLYRANCFVFFLRFTENILTLCGQNVGLFNVKTNVTYTNR